MPNHRIFWDLYMTKFKPKYRNTTHRDSLPTQPPIVFMTHNLINSYLFYDRYFDSFYLKLKKYFVERKKSPIF